MDDKGFLCHDISFCSSVYNRVFIYRTVIVRKVTAGLKETLRGMASVITALPMPPAARHGLRGVFDSLLNRSTNGRKRTGGPTASGLSPRTKKSCSGAGIVAVETEEEEEEEEEKKKKKEEEMEKEKEKEEAEAVLVEEAQLDRMDVQGDSRVLDVIDSSIQSLAMFTTEAVISAGNVDEANERAEVEGTFESTEVAAEKVAWMADSSGSASRIGIDATAMDIDELSSISATDTTRPKEADVAIDGAEKTINLSGSTEKTINLSGSSACSVIQKRSSTPLQVPGVPTICVNVSSRHLRRNIGHIVKNVVENFR